MPRPENTVTWASPTTYVGATPHEANIVGQRLLTLSTALRRQTGVARWDSPTLPTFTLCRTAQTAHLVRGTDPYPASEQSAEMVKRTGCGSYPSSSQPTGLPTRAWSRGAERCVTEALTRIGGHPLFACPHGKGRLSSFRLWEHPVGERHQRNRAFRKSVRNRNAWR